MKNPMHNPLPASLSSECKKAAAILESFINPRLKIDGQIPRKIFEDAKGIAIYTAFRVGFLGSIRFGSGLIVARLPDGNWTAPSAIAMGGVGAGGQFGAELTDFVFVLSTDTAVKTFMQWGSLTLGGNISMAVGPVGRSAEASGVVGTKSAAGVFAYSKTRGLYGGLTVEGGVLIERTDANKKIYGRKIRAKELLSGLIPSPREAEVLMNVLNGSFFQFESKPTRDQEQSVEGAEGSAQPVETHETTEAQPVEGKQPVEVELPAETQQFVEAEQELPVEAAQAIKTDKFVEAENSVNTEKPVETEGAADAGRSVDVEQPVNVEQLVETKKPVEAEQTVEGEQPVEAQQSDEAQPSQSLPEKPISVFDKPREQSVQEVEPDNTNAQISKPGPPQPTSIDEPKPTHESTPPESTPKDHKDAKEDKA